MCSLPTGTVTFLFSDIEGSTRLWDTQPELMAKALARHDALLRDAIQVNGGHVFKTVGDAFCASFRTAREGVAAAFAAQRALYEEPWPELTSIRVRIALHTGAAIVRDADYFGPTLNRVARLLSAGHGGQTLLSDATRNLLLDDPDPNWSLLNLGEHRLKDLSRPEVVYQCNFSGLPSGFPRLRSLNDPDRPNNLPIQLTSFIGREREIAEVGNCLAQSNLVTLTGSGGAGKTRLSLQAAATLLDGFPDGVWFVEFADLASGAFVASKVAQVLEVKESSGTSLADQIVDVLKSRALLLIFDNCEHVLDASARLAGAILRVCPDVRILATSRAPLAVYGERTYRIPSLSTPDPRLGLELGALTEFESVRLLLERAMTVKPDFQATERNAKALVQICSRLDGIPLAIELAAARVRSMTAEDISARLDHRFRLLTTGDRSALPRQQTLRALIDWSYELLTEPERLMLARLSVFAGGWTLTSAEAVCSGHGIDEFEVMDLLGSLLDKSLVFLDEAMAERYRMLESVKEYARERLEEVGDSNWMRSRHLDSYLGLALAAEPELTGPKQQEWLTRLEAEHDNLRAALQWCSEMPAGREEGLLLCGALHRFWATRGHIHEGRAYLADLLARDAGGQGSGAALGGALAGYGRLTWLQGDYDLAKESFENALSLYREIGDARGSAYSLLNLGNIACDQGQFEAARTLDDESLSLCRAAGDDFGVANALLNLGNIALDQGEYATAEPLYAECLVIQRRLDNKFGVGAAFHNLGLATLYQHRHSEAKALFLQGLEIFRELGHKAGIASMLNNLGIVAVRQDDPVAAQGLFQECLSLRAELGDRKGVAQALEEMGAVLIGLSDAWKSARLLGAAAALREAIGVAQAPGEMEQQASTLDRLRSDLGAAEFQVAWEQGKRLDWKDAVAEAVG